MKRLLSIVCCMLMAASSFGQQALGQRPRVKSPVVNSDGSVTFNFYDPSAQQVSVTGDFDEIRSRTLPMTKQDNGVWTVTTSPLAPELYSYSLTVDGQRFIDPANRATSSSSPRATTTKATCISRTTLPTARSAVYGTTARRWDSSAA